MLRTHKRGRIAVASQHKVTVEIKKKMNQWTSDKKGLLVGSGVGTGTASAVLSLDGVPLSATSYLWTGGQTTQTATGLVAAAYTIGVTYLYSSGSTVQCSVSGGATVTEPANTLSVSISKTLIGSCAGGELCASATGTLVNNYAWSSGETIACINPAAPADYTVTVTDVNGCTASTSYDFNGMDPACCGNYEYNFDNIPDNTLGSYNISSTVTISPANINVNDNISITSGATLTLTGCSLAIAPYIQIYVCETCTLTIEDSYLSSCTGMWTGIVNDGVVNITNSETDDAIFMLTCDRSVAPGCEFTITNSTFDRNYNNIMMANGDFSGSSCTGSVFQCTSYLKDVNLGWQLRTNRHFDLTNVTGFDLDGTSALNNIKDADFGIYGDNSSFTCENNYFYHIDFLSGGSSAVISCVNAASLQTFSATENHVENCNYGMIIESDYDCIIDNNKFTSTGMAALVATVNADNLGITYNSFANCIYGVELYQVSESTSCDISYNTFKGEFNALGVPYNIAAISIYQSDENTLPLLISRNNIKNYQWSIYAVNVHSSADVGYGAFISYNTISYTFDKDHLGNNNYYGITAESCDNFSIDNNTIDWVTGPADPYHWSASNTTGSHENLWGIVTEGTTNTAIHANIFNRNGTAIYLLGSCINNYLTCNEMTKSYPGVFAESVTSIPPQGTTSISYKNRWYGDFSPTGYFKVDGDNTSPFNWYYSGTYSAANDECPKPENTAVIYAIQTTGISQAGLCDDIQEFRVDSTYQDELLSKIANDTAQYAYDADENRYTNAEKGFKMMKENEALINTAAKEQFVQQTEQENMGLLAAVNDSISAGDLSSAETINDAVVDTNLIESNKRAVNSIVITGLQNGVVTLAGSDSATLLNIATQDPVTGGEAVYRARAMLRLRIVDQRIGSQARKSSPGKEETKQQSEIVIYPIPSTGLVYIKANENTLLTEIKLCDLTGRLLLTKYIQNKPGVYKLNLNDFAAGAYTLRIKDVTNIIVVKQLILAK
ncbi:MAG: NosD domain-containing protein [Bacteroidia bacterium]